MSGCNVTTNQRACIFPDCDCEDPSVCDGPMGLIRWAYRISEEALFRRDKKTDRENRDRALSEINARFKEFA